MWPCWGNEIGATVQRHNHYTHKVGCRICVCQRICSGKGRLCAVRCISLNFLFFLCSFSPFWSFISSCCFIFFYSSAVCPPPFSHPGGPSFHHLSPPPLLHLPLLYAKQVSTRTRRIATTSQKRQQGLGGDITPTHTHTLLTCVVSLSVSLCVISIYIHTYVFLFLHMHTHSRGLGWRWGQGELELSVCLSLVFQQEAPGPARHLSGAAAADKEEAINPRKITSTDTLSHRNTAMQPDSFHLQCCQKKKEGKEEVKNSPCGWKDGKTHRKPPSPS